MASFPERYGFKPNRTIVQTESLDDDTRVRLWNVIAEFKKTIYDKALWSAEKKILRQMWAELYRKPLDAMPSDASIWATMRQTALTGKWFEVFELIENFIKAMGRVHDDAADVLTPLFDDELSRCLVGWRFVGTELVRVDRDEEREALVDALDASADLTGANHHLSRAMAHLSSRENPDYANAVKEAISAVEAVVGKLTSEHTLGAGLKKLETAGVSIHPALRLGWDKLYGWASDESGVRHGSIDAASVDQSLAKYMVVASSAFVSYLIEEGRKASLL